MLCMFLVGWLFVCFFYLVCYHSVDYTQVCPDCYYRIRYRMCVCVSRLLDTLQLVSVRF